MSANEDEMSANEDEMSGNEDEMSANGHEADHELAERDMIKLKYGFKFRYDSIFYNKYTICYYLEKYFSCYKYR